MDIEQVEVNPLKRAILPNATKTIHGIFFSFLMYNPTDSIIIPIIVWVILIIL